jgi:hypothetical protein
MVAAGLLGVFAGARRRVVGVKVERPEPEARTNDLDADARRCRLGHAEHQFSRCCSWSLSGECVVVCSV